MSTRIWRPGAAMACLLICCMAPPLNAQETAPAAAADTSEAARKAALIDSEPWRRAMFELQEWFRTQTVYTPEEAARMRANFNARVESMTSQELKEMLADMDVKFKLLNSPQLQETRAWFAQYMAVLAERRRAELLRELPDFPTMTAKELQQAVFKIQQKKGAQARFSQGRQAQVASQLQAGQAAQTAAQQRRTQRPAYRAPYRPRSTERPFDNVDTGRRRTMTVDPLGGVWMQMTM